MIILENLIGAIIAIALLAIAFAHFMWAVGRRWPVRDEKLLARTVIGTPQVEKMPSKIASFGVAVFTLTACVLALAVADHVSGGLWLDLVALALALVFLGRGAVGFTPAWAEKTPEEPFRTLDRKTYSPLCLGIGAGFVVLVILRLF